MSVDPDDVEIASALMSVATGVPVCTHESAARPWRPVVSAYISPGTLARATRALDRAVRLARAQGLLRSSRRSVATVRGEDWATSWKRYYRPSKIADAWYVVPSWRKDFRPPHGAAAIQLDPGMAFGTGQHATTKLALQLLLPYVRSGRPVLDVGCGTGILGIAAAQLGAHVYACDSDSIAVDAARKNFALNGVRSRAVKRWQGVPKSFPRSPAIVANITADVLCALARAFAAKLEEGGALITSGVTKRGRAEVLTSFADAGLRLIGERRSGEWLAHVHRKDS
jgi:ribosomal protein L11 methyltransferase